MSAAVDDRTSVSDDPDAAERLETARALIGVEAVWSGRILHAAVDLGLLEVMDEEPVAAADVAAALDLDPDRTYRLLRALAHFDVLAEAEGRRFSITPLGALFRADHPQSMRANLLFNRSPAWSRAMLHLPAVVRDGGPTGFVREFGEPFFAYLQDAPGLRAAYAGLMDAASRTHPEPIARKLVDTGISAEAQVCDVGGGHGRLLAHLLAAAPSLSGTVLDNPETIADADERWARELGVDDRCEYVAGDMFEAVPAADAYILKWILHNFADAPSRRVLEIIYEASPADARLFVIESPIPGPDTPHDAKRLDVAMMVQVGGRERTEDEYVSLLAAAGWEHVATRDPGVGTLRVLEAEKA